MSVHLAFGSENYQHVTSGKTQVFQPAENVLSCQAMHQIERPTSVEQECTCGPSHGCLLLLKVLAMQTGGHNLPHLPTEDNH
eukprot:6173943-Amphidinium_carterae.1